MANGTNRWQSITIGAVMGVFVTGGSALWWFDTITGDTGVCSCVMEQGAADVNDNCPAEIKNKYDGTSSCW